MWNEIVSYKMKAFLPVRSTIYVLVFSYSYIIEWHVKDKTFQFTWAVEI